MVEICGRKHSLSEAGHFGKYEVDEGRWCSREINEGFEVGLRRATRHEWNVL